MLKYFSNDKSISYYSIVMYASHSHTGEQDMYSKSILYT